MTTLRSVGSVAGKVGSRKQEPGGDSLFLGISEEMGSLSNSTVLNSEMAFPAIWTCGRQLSGESSDVLKCYLM